MYLAFAASEASVNVVWIVIDISSLDLDPAISNSFTWSGVVRKCLSVPVANLTGYARRSSTAKKANRPIKIRRTATAMTGDCIFSCVASALIPAIGANDSPHR